LFSYADCLRIEFEQEDHGSGELHLSPMAARVRAEKGTAWVQHDNRYSPPVS